MNKNPEKMSDLIKQDRLFMHDLNNHLMAIYNYAEMLEGDLPEGGKMQKFAKSIRASALAIQGMMGEHKAGMNIAGAQKGMAGPATILVVDDQPDIREILAILLEEEGYSVIVCESAMEALETVRQESSQIDLVVADYSMPGMNGAEFAEQVQRIFPAIPVIIVSGQEQSMLDTLKDLRAVKGVVKKPVVPDQLLAEIEKVLN